MAEAMIRPARRADLPALTEIYNHYIVNTAITFDTQPFTVEERAAWFDLHEQKGRYRLMVAQQSGRAVGFASTGPFRVKPAYDTTVEITIYCGPGARGRGLGTALYSALFKALEGEDIHRAVAGITMPNDASIALHKRFGFTEVGVFSENGRKLGRYWDVLWMEKRMA